jgi:hypothetical protein
MSTAPDELQADCYLTRDKCWVEFVYFGHLDTGERLLANFRRFSKPEGNSVKRRPFSQVYNMDVGESSTPFKFISVKGTYIEQFSDEIIDLVLNRLTQVPRSATPFFIFNHYMHGEVCNVLPNATAFELRKPGAVHLAFAVTWQDSVDTTACLAWHQETFEDLQPYSGGRIYANFMSTPGGSTAKAVFGTNFSRLAQVKKKYDPDNIFHLNQNILPS